MLSLEQVAKGIEKVFKVLLCFPVSQHPDPKPHLFQAENLAHDAL